MKNALITGGSSGIGQALAWKLALKNFKVFINGRNKKRLDETRQKYPDKIIAISADISRQSGRDKLIKFFNQDNDKLDFLIHNAGYEGPFKSIKEVSLDEWRYTHTTNLEAPVFITQKLLPYLNRSARILLISSGLAYHPLPNSSAYSTSKAALHMLYQCLNVELNHLKIYTGLLLPGVVDTPMQQRLRNIDKKYFPDVEHFIHLKKTGQLLSPTKVADYIAHVLLETNNQEFVSKIWDISVEDCSNR